VGATTTAELVQDNHIMHQHHASHNHLRLRTYSDCGKVRMRDRVPP
jgi:hypothetical protein